jgi:hypothetical protein
MAARAARGTGTTRDGETDMAKIRTLKPTQPPLQDIPLLMRMRNEGGRVKK